MLASATFAALAALGSGCGLTPADDSQPSRKSDLPSAKAAQLVTAAGHSCALTTEGGVRCWGSNGLGQLGAGMNDVLDPDDKNYNKRFVAVQVTGLASGVTAIAAGGEAGFTCALTAAGGVKCWGENTDGQLGDGTTTSSGVPVDVVGLTSGVTAITAGTSHACALTASGGIKCWGNNEWGQLGAGHDMRIKTAVDVVGLTSGIKAVSAGAAHGCALTVAGGVSCWGHNTGGECGVEDQSEILAPNPIAGLSGVAQLTAGGFNTCAVSAAGGVQCWGNNRFGQLGNDLYGPLNNSAVPVNVMGLASGVTSVHPSSEFAMALVGGGIKLWGNFTTAGSASEIDSMTPIDSVVTSGASQLSTGMTHACYISTAGAVLCWGDNNSGQAGYYEDDDGIWYETQPVAISSLP